MRPAVGVFVDADLDKNNGNQEPAPTCKRPTNFQGKTEPLQTLWEKVDLDNPPLPEYQHIPLSKK